MGPKDGHLVHCVSHPELLRGEIFLFIMIVLNLAVFSCGGSLYSEAEHLQTVKFSRAAGNLFLGLVASKGLQLWKLSGEKGCVWEGVLGKGDAAMTERWAGH